MGAKNEDKEPAKQLEDFWLNIAEKITPSVLPDNLRCKVSSMYAATYGNSEAFEPLWFTPTMISNPYVYFLSFYNRPYLYSTRPLKRSLSKYIDFNKLNNTANNNRPRLIITSTDMQKSKSVTFDSKFTSIDADHIIACAGFPFYGIAWTEKDGKYLWDGSLQSNTPLREVIDASPKHDKNGGPPGMLKAMKKLLQDDLHVTKERIKIEEFTGY